MRNARKGDHEERAEDAPKWVSVPRETGEPKGGKGYSGSIKRVDKVNEVVRVSDSILCFSDF